MGKCQKLSVCLAEAVSIIDAPGLFFPVCCSTRKHKQDDTLMYFSQQEYSQNIFSIKTIFLCFRL